MTTSAGGRGTKRRADRRTWGSIGTARPFSATATGCDTMRIATRRARSAASSLTGGARGPGRSSMWSGSAAIRRRSASGSTPYPPAPGTTAMAVPLTFTVAGRGAVLIWSVTRATSASTLAGDTVKVSGTSRVGASPTVEITRPPRLRGARAASRAALIRGLAPSSRRVVAMRNIGLSARVITTRSLSSSRARRRVTARICAASMWLTSTPATVTAAGAWPLSSPLRAAATTPTTASSRRATTMSTGRRSRRRPRGRGAPVPRPPERLPPAGRVRGVSVIRARS